MSNPSNLLNTALRLQQSGDLAGAENIYRELLRINPNDLNALHFLGVVASQTNRSELAIDLISKAIHLAPDNGGMHSNLGLALARAERFTQAIASYQRAIELNPKDVESHNNLGALLSATGQRAAAEKSFRTAVQVNPAHTGALSNLCACLLESGQFESALEVSKTAIHEEPNHARLQFNYGLCCSHVGRPEQAAIAYRQAIQLDPNFAEAFNNYSLVLLSLGKIQAAVAAAQRAVQIHPRYVEAIINLGHALKEQGAHELAIASFQQAYDIKPGLALAPLVMSMQEVCQWENLEVLTNQAIEWFENQADAIEMRSIDPFFFVTLSMATTAEQQYRWTRRWVENRFGPARPTSVKHRNIDASITRPKIKLGYLSADFHNHATSALIVELLESHARHEFEAIGFSYGPDDGSPLRRRILQAFDRVHDIKLLSNAEAAAKIRAEEIDILIDLKGYTHPHRIEILAERPAPIQVGYLGYPGTTGTDFIDYILVDDFVVPPSHQAFYSERLIYLPRCYQANDSRREIATNPPTRTECGLDEKSFIFCSFNSVYKISPPVFQAWMRILKAVPDSLLWLLAGNPLAIENLRREATRLETDASRLIFAPKIEASQHLARHVKADLFLDTFPVNAHTTASDALRMGLPLITIAGQSFVSRVAGSLLRELRLDRLVTENIQDYEELAVRLAMNRRELTEIKNQLLSSVQQSQLFSGTAIAKDIERAYREMIDGRIEN